MVDINIGQIAPSIQNSNRVIKSVTFNTLHLYLYVFTYIYICSKYIYITYIYMLFLYVCMHVIYTTKWTIIRDKIRKHYTLLKLRNSNGQKKKFKKTWKDKIIKLPSSQWNMT